MQTKKMLVPIDLENPKKNIKDFIYPSLLNGEYVFKGIISGKIWSNGIISFIGKDVTKNDLFARIVNSGVKIENVNSTLQTLESYIEEIKGLSLGTVTKIETINDNFKIVAVGRKPKNKFFKKSYHKNLSWA